MDVIISKTTDILNIELETRKSGNLIPQFTAHDAYEIYVVYSGERYMYLNRTLYNVSAGDAVMIPSNTPHRSFGNTGFIGICLEFSDNYLFDNFDNGIYNEAMTCFTKEIITVTDAAQLDQIYNLAKAAHNKEEKRRECFVETIRILRSYLPSASPAARLSSNSDMSPISNYLQKNFSEISCPDDICRHFNISKSRLCHLFKEQTGTTVSRYINALRIQRAAKLITETSTPINEIARLCGYNNTQYFNREFKKYIGTSPVKYRKRMFESGKYHTTQ